MMEAIRSWLLGLAGAAVVCAVCGELTARGPVKSVQRLLGGCVMALALAGPLLRLDFGGYALNLAKYREEARSVSAAAEEISNSLSRTFIAGECEAYIWDKAHALGAALTGVKVELRWSGEGVWYPVGAELRGPYHAALAESIEEELGVPKSAQRWVEGEDDG